MKQAQQSSEVQTEQIQGQQTIQIGFEKALTMMNPEWRSALTPEQVNQFRHFYHQGVQDISFLIQMSNQNMQQNLDAVMNTVIVTGNEAQIEKLRQDTLEAQQAAEPATKSKKVAKAPKAPAKTTKAATVKGVPTKGAKAVPAKQAKPAKGVTKRGWN